MAEIQSWSVTAANNTAAPPDGAPEAGVKLGQLNNIIREMMAVLARWYKDSTNLVSGGTSGAFTVTLGRSLPAYVDGLRFVWRNHVSNLAGCSLSINGLAAKAVVDASYHAVATSALDLNYNDTYYNAGLDKFVVSNLSPEVVIPIGSIMLFNQTTAPARWFQNLNWHDRLIRIVGNGTEGQGTAGTWSIGGLSGETANHTHSFSVNTGAPSAAIPAPQGSGQGVAPQGHIHGVSGATSGESNVHTHTGDGTWRPAYLNVISCQRSY